MTDGPVAWRAVLAQGRAAFNRGEFFAAHELWEEAWSVLAGAERLHVQGLIQIAAGLHHLQQGRPGPAARLLERGLAKLPPGGNPLPDDLPVDSLAPAAARLLAALSAPASELPAPETLKL
jgi:hypothetical protein